jgi:spore germination protein YaaH
MRKKKMTKEEIEKKKKVIIKTFLSIIAVIIILIVAYVANDFIILDKNKKINLVINNNNVTSNLKKDVLVDNNVVYLSKQDIANFFDKYIYKDEKNNKIITTYDKKIASIGFEENEININGANKKIYASAIEKDNTIYLPISEMLDVYGIEIKNIEDSKVITIDSTNREQKKAIVTSQVAVKSSTNFISKTVDRVKKGDYVIVVSNDGKWAKVRTDKGKVGYIKSKKIANEVIVRENMEEEKQIQGKVNLVWDYYSEYASAPDRNGTKIEGVNVVSPSFFYLDKNGNVQQNVGDKGEEYIKWAHNNGYKVWPMISNSGDGMLSVTSNIMNDYDKRQKLIEDIVNLCVKYKIDGINIDFENMKKEDIDLYSRFIIELTPRIKEIGLVISVDVTAPDGGDTWSLCFDRNVIGHVADYIIFMAYDQYGVSSTKPGTTAGYDWIELSLKKFLETEEIKSDKIILAVPFYTRLWTEDSNGKVKSDVVNMKNINKVLPESVEKTWDDNLKQYYVEYEEKNTTKKMWVEDLESIKAKIELITKYNLAGSAAWEKDREDPEVWSVINQELNK